MSVSAVIPTYRRRDALVQTLPDQLKLHDIDEIIVVDDGSDDDTSEAVLALGLDGVRVVRHDVNRGLPAARNTGAASATTDWILFLEDDCGFPIDYATRLLAAAEAEGADIVGAPWTSTPHDVLALGAADRPVDTVGFLSPPWTFPTQSIETPFLPALALVNRRVFERVTYDEGFRGNFYREESDFFVSARRAGFRVILTPTTSSWQIARWDGGCRLPSLEYDVFAARNTWRFLRKHGSWLRNEGLLARRPLVVQAQVTAPLVLRQLKRPAVWAKRRLNSLASSRRDPSRSR